MRMFRQTKFRRKRISSLVNMVKTIEYFDYMSSHCDLELENIKLIMHKTPLRLTYHHTKFGYTKYSGSENIFWMDSH